MSDRSLQRKRIRQGVILGLFGIAFGGCAGDVGCHVSGDHFDPPPATSYTGGGGGSLTAPFLPATNDVALVQDGGVLFVLNVANNVKQSVRGNQKTFSEPMMAGKGNLITCLFAPGAEAPQPTITSETTPEQTLLTSTRVSHPCLDPSGNAAYALVPAQTDGDTHLRIYQAFPDRRTPLSLTDGTVDALSPSVSPSGTQYVYARQVAGFQNELYIDNLTDNVDAGTLIFTPPVNASVGLPFWGQDGGQDMIFFQLNNADGSSSIVKIKPDGTGMFVLKSTGGGLNGCPIQVANGRIVFHSFDTGNMDIWSMLPDGTDLVNHTQSPGIDEEMRNFFAS
jgi:hypothetical protein